MARLLIVDDEIEICDFLKMFFESRGFNVTTALSGNEAVPLVTSENPHIVLLDVMMPGMSGLETLKIIKETHPHVHVIIVTAVETKTALDEALRLGADNYITKPLSLEYLESDVQTKLNNITGKHLEIKNSQGFHP